MICEPLEKKDGTVIILKMFLSVTAYVYLQEELSVTNTYSYTYKLNTSVHIFKLLTHTATYIN